MKLRRLSLFLLPILFWTDAFVVAQVSEKDIQQIPVRRITLFSRQKYKDEYEDYGKSAFSFQHGVRSEVGLEITRNDYELEYGNISWNGDSDWFTVTMVTDDRSRIKDLGEMNWAEVFDVPVLFASPEPRYGIKWPKAEESFEESSDGQVTRVVAGHMYVVHTKDGDSDSYAMFRVEKLVPSDRCVISWKPVPSPER